MLVSEFRYYLLFKGGVYYCHDETLKHSRYALYCPNNLSNFQGPFVMLHILQHLDI